LVKYAGLYAVQGCQIRIEQYLAVAYEKNAILDVCERDRAFISVISPHWPN